ncbi:radical SAM protein [Archaeoglobus veneficus]|uniref:Radical SAM domain protein n=1 Tax=Archaeoglobus veneficus (strain DSM 11195 / SNP6) TaxID=693661 RepID=F2KQV9_ARCVS|nr:radical SAM protein [Archaeoglobus veneficus]AEA47765.1 Radical SAM domain protein [Archaeoglobus veneficus SNP6]
MTMRIVSRSYLKELERFVEEAEYPSHCIHCEGIEDVEEPKHHPSYEITSACNLKCVFCYSYSALKAGKAPKPGYYGDLNPKAITISQYGEPLIVGHEKLSCIISELRKRFKARIDLQTNGTLLKEEVDADIVMISLDASNRESYARITGVDMFENVLKAMDIVAASKSIGVLRTIYLPGINDTELQQIAEIGYERGMDEFMLQPCSIHPGIEGRLLRAGYDMEKDTLYDYLDAAYRCVNVRIPGCLLKNIRRMMEVMDFEDVVFMRRNQVSAEPPEIRREWRFVIEC